jgi:hypothetical protein
MLPETQIQIKQNLSQHPQKTQPYSSQVIMYRSKPETELRNKLPNQVLNTE